MINSISAGWAVRRAPVGAAKSVPVTGLLRSSLAFYWVEHVDVSKV
jgi:hypothetical protein